MTGRTRTFNQASNRASNQASNRAGLTLLEVLIAMAIMGVLMLAFTQLFGGSLRASSDISARNELLSEGQIAQQIIVSKLKQAAYVYPPGTNIQMTNTMRTRNTLRGGQNWTVGVDPIVAMILPPKGDPDGTQCDETSTDDADARMCFMFYAYYPIRRGTFVDEADPDSAPNPDPANENAWLLMEYRAHLFDLQARSNSTRLLNPPNSNAVLTNPNITNVPNIKSRIARILVDYAQPTNNLFTIRNDGSVELNLQMGREQGGKTLELPPLNVRTYPRNAPAP